MRLSDRAKRSRRKAPMHCAALWPQLLDAGIDLLAQELIPGAEAQIESYHCYVDRRGDVAGEFTGRKIRTFPVCLRPHHGAGNHRRRGRAAVRPRYRRAARPDRRCQARLQARPSRQAASLGDQSPLYAVASRRRRCRRQYSGAGLCRSDGNAAAAGGAGESGRALVPRLEGFSGRAASGVPLTTWLPWAIGCEAKSSLSWNDPMPAVRAALHRLLPAAWRNAACAAGRHDVDRSMRLALISDIHANLEALEATFDDIADSGVDRIVCLGDIVGYNTRPRRVHRADSRRRRALRRRQSRSRRVRAASRRSEFQQRRGARGRLDAAAPDRG